MHARMLSRFSHVWLYATLWTVAHQAPLSTGFSRQEYWSGLPFPSPMHAYMLSRFSRVWLYVTLWTVAHQASLSTGFSRQEYWSGLPFLSPKEGSKQTQLSRFRKDHNNLKPFGSTCVCVCVCVCVFCVVLSFLFSGIVMHLSFLKWILGIICS